MSHECSSHRLNTKQRGKRQIVVFTYIIVQFIRRSLHTVGHKNKHYMLQKHVFSKLVVSETSQSEVEALLVTTALPSQGCVTPFGQRQHNLFSSDQLVIYQG